MPIPTTHWLLVALASILVVSSAAGAQRATDLPFGPGERLTFTGRVRAGVAGGGTMWIGAATQLRGTTVWPLHSDMEGHVGPLRATDQSSSALDPATMGTLRFTTRERHLISRHDDAVDVYAAEKRWSAESGATGTLVTTAPLDELSFLYYVRALAFPSDSTARVNRHYDASRNPTLVRLVGRDTIEVGAGRFAALVVEMRVRDTQHYQGEGVIRIHLSDDRCRLLLQLESQMPGSGAATLALASYEGTRTACTAKLP